jgi:hypothetical protein
VCELFLCKGDGEVKSFTMSPPFSQLAAEEASVTTPMAHHDVVDRMFLQAKIERRMKDEYMVQCMGNLDVPTLLYQKVVDKPEQISQMWQRHVMPHTACIVKNASDIAELQSTQAKWEEDLDSVQDQIDSSFESMQRRWQGNYTAIQYQIDSHQTKWEEKQEEVIKSIDDMQSRVQSMKFHIDEQESRCDEEILESVEDIPSEIELLWCHINNMKDENKELRQEIKNLRKKKSVITCCDTVLNIAMMAVVIFMVTIKTINF